jgi:LL-H family phage holin
LETDALTKVVFDVLLVLTPVLVAVVAEYVRRVLGTERLRRIQEELATKQALALAAVRFVEQVYHDLHGEEKYQQALEWLSSRLAQYGLKATPEELRGLIEAALRAIKDEFGNDWAAPDPAGQAGGLELTA